MHFLLASSLIALLYFLRHQEAVLDFFRFMFLRRLRQINLMNGILRVVLLFLLYAFGTTSFAQSSLPISAYGVWDRSDGSVFNSNDSNYNYLHGVTYDMAWKDIQPDSENIFKWEMLQSAIDRAVSRNVYLYIGINVGPQSPEWIYTSGVPKVITDDTSHSWQYYPYYLDTNYRKFFRSLITEMGKFIQGQPPEKLNKIAFVQVKTGCTGDECAYKGDAIDSNYTLTINGELWRNFRLEAFRIYKESFLNTAIQIPLLFNNIDSENYPIEWKWVIDNIVSGFGFKGSAYVRGHHLSDERIFTDSWKKYTINPQGLALFSRSEMDQGWTKPFYVINKELGFYWGAISGLNSGLSVWDISIGALQEAGTNTSIQQTFRFFNKYANQIYPSSSTRAFVVLHGGLDASDTIKFPTALYGSCSQSNKARYAAICNDAVYASHGAKMDDLQSATLGQVAQRDRQTGYNDAGWQIWPTNYSRFISQVEPDIESIGLFRIGGTITKTSPVYSRFARSFEHSSGKDGMYFKFEDKFIKSGTNKINISVIYYDSIPGSKWELKYDAGPNNFKSARVVTGVGSRTWKQESFSIVDGVMNHNGPKQADFALLNCDTTDDIFHCIETEIAESVDNTEYEFTAPHNFSLSQNYPNPFNPNTVIAFELPKSSHVLLRVYNLLGQEISTLINSQLSEGSHEVLFDAASLPSGVYFYVMRAGKFLQTKKMLLIK